ncbi:hypothetical protein D9M68_365530 [compost metagenome]
MKESTFPAEGFVRLTQIIGPKGPIPVSRSTWYAMVRAGKAPPPVALGPRIAAYPVEAVKAFIESFHARGGKSNG